MPLFTYCSLAFTMLLWGGTFIAGRMLAGSVHPANAAFLRFFIASLALIAVMRFSKERFIIPPIKTWIPILLLGATGIYAYNIFFFNGLSHISAGRAALIIASTPLVITLFAAVFLKEKLSLLKICGVLLSRTGAITVISNGHPSGLFTGGFGPGEKALVGCVFSWAAYSLIGRTVLGTLTPITAVCYSSIIGTLFLAIPAARQGLFHNLGSITLPDWYSLAFLGILGTALGFPLYYQGIKKIGATRAGIFINLVPVFALLLSWLFLGESIKNVVLAGGALVLIGVSLTNYKKKGK